MFSLCCSIITPQFPANGHCSHLCLGCHFHHLHRASACGPSLPAGALVILIHMLSSLRQGVTNCSTRHCKGSASPHSLQLSELCQSEKWKWLLSLTCLLFEMRSRYITQAGLKMVVFLPPSPKSQGLRHAYLTRLELVLTDIGLLCAGDFFSTELATPSLITAVHYSPSSTATQYSRSL